MTRINLVPPQLLTDQHLLAETREIKRLPGNFTRLSKKAIIPEKYCLGKGHVLFFVKKPKFTLERYLGLRKECLNRNFKVQNFSNNWDIFSSLNDIFIPSKQEIKINLDRIKEKILMNPEWYRLNSKKINFEEYIFELENYINL